MGSGGRDDKGFCTITYIPPIVFLPSSAPPGLGAARSHKWFWNCLAIKASELKPFANHVVNNQRSPARGRNQNHAGLGGITWMTLRVKCGTGALQVS